MKLLIVGRGKLANALISSDVLSKNYEVIKWEAFSPQETEAVILLHAGSGRELPQAIDFCQRTKSVFIELSTGLDTQAMIADFPLIICPNTSVLLLKTMNLLRLSGNYFQSEKIGIVESHQESKTSAPEIAISMAESLHVSIDQIQSVRDKKSQLALGISSDFLDKHAYHKITIGDGSEQITIETKILGHESYVNGVQKIVEAVSTVPLKNKRYSVLELIDQDLL